MVKAFEHAVSHNTGPVGSDKEKKKEEQGFWIVFVAVKVVFCCG